MKHAMQATAFGAPPAPASPRGPSRRDCVAVGATLAMSAALAVLMRPTLREAAPVEPLDRQVPREVGDWRVVPTLMPPVSAAVVRADGTAPDGPYDDVLMRSYGAPTRLPVALVVAYARSQRQEVKVHRPELCYVAQGYEVLSLSSATVAGVPAKRMLVRSGLVTEAVSYWIRIGTLYSEDAFDTRLHILREGLHGRVPDGVLVRASARVFKRDRAQDVHARIEAFLEQLLASMQAPGRALLRR